jgi:hypothetical protein
MSDSLKGLQIDNVVRSGAAHLKRRYKATTAAEPKSIPTFQKEVRCFSSRELVRNVLFYMQAHEFSQIVVRWHGNIRLLSNEGIVKWLTALLADGKDHIATRTVGEVIPFEKSDKFAIVGPNTPVSEVRAAFRAEQDQPKIAAVIITDDGTPRGNPLGFVDHWDMLLTYSDNFRYIRWQGYSFTLSNRQADVVRILYRSYENGIPEVPDKDICKELGTSESRLRDTFRKSKVWGTLIVKGTKPGMRRLTL